MEANVETKKPDENLCPSCGKVKQYPTKHLCFYCYRRGNMGTMKLIVLEHIKAAEDTKRLSTNELVDVLNRFQYIGKKVNIHQMQNFIAKLRSYKLITSAKRRPNGVGRPITEHMVSKSGNRFLAKYKHNWMLGLLVPIKFKGKAQVMTQDHRDRASSIRGKLMKHEYEIYTFIFPERRKL